MKATPAHWPASDAVERGVMGAPDKTCLNFELHERNDKARLRRAIFVKWVSLMATTSAGIPLRTWCLPCNPEGLQTPIDHVSVSGPGTRASPMRHIVKIKRQVKKARKGRQNPWVTLAKLGQATGLPSFHSVRGFLAKIVSIRAIWSVNIDCIC